MWRRAALLTAACFLAWAPGAWANHIPAPTGYVNDFAHVLTTEQAKTLDEQLKTFDTKTGNQIAVATVDSLGGDDINDFTVRAFEEWKVGRQGKDNGVLLLVAKQDRQVRIEVGYGLEGSITDAEAGRIIRDNITPRFKSGDYYGGLGAGLGAIEGQINRDAANISPPPAAPAQPATGFPFYLLLFLWPILSYLGAFLARSKSWWAGGVLGAGAGYGLGMFIHSALITAAILGGFGLLLDYVLSRNYQARRRQGLDTGFWTSGGGFWGGGGGGFGGGGGGFGGFGGGGSGGGGASGRW
jgi:uncharacterized protein